MFALLCGRNYAVLEDLAVDDGSRRRLFLSLLNARVILAVLRSALALRGLEYPKNLRRVQIAVTEESAGIPDGLQCPCSGDVLNAWAKNVEATICAELDSFRTDCVRCRCRATMTCLRCRCFDRRH